MASIPQIRTRLLEGGFPEKQADVLAHVVIEAHDDLVTRADFHALTGVVKELADAQKDLTRAQERTENRVEELAQEMKGLANAQQKTAQDVQGLTQEMKSLANAQQKTAQEVQGLTQEMKGLANAQQKTEHVVQDLVVTQKKILIRLDRLDGRSLELTLARRLPAYVGRVFRRCRVIEPVELVDGLDGRLSDAERDELLRTDVLATARHGDQSVHLAVEVSCTADSDDIDRAASRAALLARVGIPAIGIVACEMISDATLAYAHKNAVRILLDGRIMPDGGEGSAPAA